jgi:hypothetical protein
VPKPLDDIGTGVFRRPRDEPGGYPLTGQVVSGMQTTRARSAASARNRRTFVTLGELTQWAELRRWGRRNRDALEPA